MRCLSKGSAHTSTLGRHDAPRHNLTDMQITRVCLILQDKVRATPNFVVENEKRPGEFSVALYMQRVFSTRLIGYFRYLLSSHRKGNMGSSGGLERLPSMDVSPPKPSARA